MCDVSDGLLSELNHIAVASQVGIEIDSKMLALLSGFAELSELAGPEIWKWILTGGEDHVFVATTSGAIPDGSFEIGKVIAGTKVSVLGINEITEVGFRHF